MTPYPYRRPLVAILFALAGLWLFTGCGSPGNVQAQTQFQHPTFIPPGTLVPAPKPTDGREVALLDLVVTADSKGVVESVILQRGRIIKSYGPSVFGLAGPWTIELVGNDTLRYGTLNPLYVRVYGDEKDVPHTGFMRTKATWQLVVPLYRREQNLGVKQISIYDEKNRLIFSTPVDREKWLAR